MSDHADFGIIAAGLRRGDQDERRVQPGGFVRSSDQLAADPLMLIGEVDGEVGEIGAETGIGEGAGDADEPPVAGR